MTRIAPDEQEKRLISREQKLIRDLGEAGYVSPFFIGYPKTWSVIDDDADGYLGWRNARDNWTATSDVKYLKKMTEHVTMDNPPLARDIEVKKSGGSVAGWKDLGNTGESGPRVVQLRLVSVVLILLLYAMIMITMGIF